MDDNVKKFRPSQAHADVDIPALKRPSREEAEEAVKTLIAWAGDDPEREGLVETPSRVIRAYEELFAGYNQNPAHYLQKTFEDVAGYDDLILLTNIPFYSHCEHHIVPFKGLAHVGYYPDDKIVGLSKLARIVECFARRMQTQEKMTSQIITTIDEELKPLGAAVLLEAEHQCMSMRGIQKSGVKTLTKKFTGIFETDPQEQVHFMTLVQRQNTRTS